MNVEEYTDEPATAEISVIREPSIEYARNKEIPTFFGQPLVKGSFSHTRIVSPSQQSYIFYQYDEAHGYRITRPLNANLLPFHRVPRRFLHPIREVYRVLGRSQEISETNHFLGRAIAFKFALALQISVLNRNDAAHPAEHLAIGPYEPATVILRVTGTQCTSRCCRTDSLVWASQRHNYAII